MKVHRTFQQIGDAARGAVVAIGNFDGVHRGHKALIAAARERAEALSAPLGIVTFEPHPLQILRPDKAPKQLTPLRAKTKILAELGVDRIFALTFDPAMRQRSPEAFVEDVLHDGLCVRHVVVGYDFRFGHKAAGDAALLGDLGERHGFGLSKVDPVSWRGEVCSSSRIRLAVEAGDMALATDLLGHPFVVEGRVVGGERRGRELGFPTANIRPPRSPACWPPAGIYAVRAGWQHNGQTVWGHAAASLGFRPTFDDAQGCLLEVHLLDRSVDLYGKRLCCQFVERLRREESFDDIERLKAQMTKDCENAKAVLAKTRFDPYMKG